MSTMESLIILFSATMAVVALLSLIFGRLFLPSLFLVVRVRKNLVFLRVLLAVIFFIQDLIKLTSCLSLHLLLTPVSLCRNPFSSLLMGMVVIGYPIIMLAENVALRKKIHLGAHVLSMVQSMDIIVRFQFQAPFFEV